MRAVIVGAALALVLSGCGVGTSDQAETAAGTDVPYRLLERGETTTPTTLPELVSTTAQTWFVAGDVVVPVTREVAAPVTIDRLVGALVAGPTEDEATFGLRSAVPIDSVGDATLVAGVATIDLRSQFAAAPPREQVLALAQIVHTATELDTVEVVTFTLDGQSIDVPRADGSISDGPVTRLDYRDVRAGG